MLEEHSSCEIPAGCGGVVLRWFNPLRAIPIEFWMYLNGDVKFALDGEFPKSARPLLDYGEHVLSFVVSGFKAKEGIFMFAASAGTKRDAPVESSAGTEFLSDADGSWKYTSVAPNDPSWMQPGFDDTSWQPLVLKPVPEPERNGMEWFRRNKLVELGAKGLGIEEDGTWLSRLLRLTPATNQLWIRRIFHLIPPAR